MMVKWIRKKLTTKKSEFEKGQNLYRDFDPKAKELFNEFYGQKEELMLRETLNLYVRTKSKKLKLEILKLLYEIRG